MQLGSSDEQLKVRTIIKMPYEFFTQSNCKKEC